MAKVSAVHQAAIDAKNANERRALAYHFILRAMMDGSGKWGSLKRVGSLSDQGDSVVWQITFSPRMIDGVILETFTSSDGDESINCYFLADLTNLAHDSQFSQLYWHAVEMERIQQNAEALQMAASA